jgi:hypothetical protein
VALAVMAVASVTLWAGPARADGILEAITANEELYFTSLSTRTTDAVGTTTKTDVMTYGSRTNVRVNYNLLPTLNLNAGGFYDKEWSDVSNADTVEIEVTRLRPYAWLTLGDPIFNVAAGYDLFDDSTKTDRFETQLTRSTYNGHLNWRPTDLPWTQFRYTRTATTDAEGRLIDLDQDHVFLKSEYSSRGLDAYYAGTYLTTHDNVRDASSTQTTHEGKVLYTTRPFLDGRIVVTTDNRIRFTELTTEFPAGVPGFGITTALPVPAIGGLSALDDTPLVDPLGANPALIDADLVTSAGVNIGFVGLPPQPRRNVGLDLGSARTVTMLRVWVEGFGPAPLPADITGFYTWEIYTSTDNLNWALHATVPGALFGPLDRRFEISFPAVTTRYIKAVTRPLPGGVIGTTNTSLFPTIFITEVQAFVDRTAQGGGASRSQSITQLFRSHIVDLRAILFRTPSLYYRFNAEYQEFDDEDDARYIISNGLFFTHRLSRILSTSMNGTVEFGKEQDEERSAVRYYAALTATPLPTLTDSIVVSGNREWFVDTTTTTNSVVLYNAAQLYRGLDATLNLGAVVSSQETDGGGTLDRTEYYVNAGAGVTPHPNLTLSAYYLGKITDTSGTSTVGIAGPGRSTNRQTTEHHVDATASFTPFRSLAFTGTTSIVFETDRETQFAQNFGGSWSPFPDGNLQLSFFYSESRLSDESVTRLIQPTVRWYLTSRRRSYLEATYQMNTLDGVALTTESNLFSMRLNVYY